MAHPWDEDPEHTTSRPMRDVGLPLLRAPEEALADAPFDVEFVHVPLVLDPTPRDKDVGLVVGPVPIHRRAGGPAVVDEDLAIPQDRCVS